MRLFLILVFLFFGFALIQFVFFLLTGNVNEPLSRVCSWLLKFYNQIISYLLFQTDLPPFPLQILMVNRVQMKFVDSEIEEEVPTEEKEETS